MTVWYIPYRQPSSISSSINCKASQLCSMANKAASGKKNHCNWSNCVELQSAKREISKHRKTSNGASGGCTQVFVLLELSGCVLVGTPVVCNGLGHVQGPWSLRSNHAMPCASASSRLLHDVEILSEGLVKSVPNGAAILLQGTVKERYRQYWQQCLSHNKHQTNI